MSRQAQPANPLGQRLTQLFTYRWKWLSMPLDNLFIEPEWTTNKKFPLRPRVLWKKWQDAAEVIGVRFGSKTKYAMLDIDAHSDYIEAIGTIKGALETVGIVRTVTIRSSYSGGIHLYIPLPVAVATFSIACMLHQLLEAHGFHIAPGQLEIFPNQKQFAKSWKGEFSEYNGHRLPLQPCTGSVMLDDDLNPVAGGEDLSRFFALWDNAALLNDKDEIAESLSVARANRRYRNRAKQNRKVEEWKADLQYCIDEGWTDRGQTNAILKDLACFGVVFEGLKGVDLVHWMVDNACNMPGFGQYCDHKHDIDRRCAQWARSAEKFWWPLGTEPLRERPSLMDIAKQRADTARERIATALKNALWLDEDMSIRERVRRLCEMACCSARTLYKNRDLWHPDHNPDSKPVTDHPEGDIADPAEQLRLIRAGLGTPDTWAVTGFGGDYEAFNNETRSSKKFTSEGEKRGCGGEEGVSTAPAFQWPPLSWEEGAVGDFG